MMFHQHQARVKYQTIFSALILMAFTTDVALAQDYEIKIQRENYVGQVYDMEISVTRNMKQTFIKPNREPESFTTKQGLQFKGRVKILEVNELNQIKSFEATTESCLCLEPDGTYSKPLRPGSKVITKKENGQTIHIVDGTQLLPEMSHKLSPIFYTDENVVTMDDYYGTLNRQKAGSAWPIHPQNFAKCLVAFKMEVDPKNISGTVKFLKPVMVDNENCQRLEINIAMKNLKVPFDKYRIVKSSSKSSIWMDAPFDLKEELKNYHSEAEFLFNTVSIRQTPDQPEEKYDIHDKVNRIFSSRRVK